MMTIVKRGLLDLNHQEKIKYIEVGFTYRLILASEVVNKSVDGDVKVTKRV